MLVHGMGKHATVASVLYAATKNILDSRQAMRVFSGTHARSHYFLLCCCKENMSCN